MRNFFKKLTGIIVLLIFLWLISLVINYKTYEIVNDPEGNGDIIAFGDSLIVGVGSENGGFVPLLADALGKDIYNAGDSGDTTEDALLRIDEVLAKKPKVVIVLLGGNDFIRRVPSNETFSNLETIIKKIQNSGAAVLLLGVRGGVIKDNFEDDFRKLAKRTGSAYVPDVMDGVLGVPKYMSDPVHPNDEGYIKIYEKVLPVLSELLK